MKNPNRCQTAGMQPRWWGYLEYILPNQSCHGRVLEVEKADAYPALTEYTVPGVLSQPELTHCQTNAINYMLWELQSPGVIWYKKISKRYAYDFSSGSGLSLSYDILLCQAQPSWLSVETSLGGVAYIVSTSSLIVAAIQVTYCENICIPLVKNQRAEEPIQRFSSWTGNNIQKLVRERAVTLGPIYMSKKKLQMFILYLSAFQLQTILL